MKSRIEKKESLNQFTVLLVDDHPAIRKTTRDLIESEYQNVTVVEASNLNAAQTSIRRSVPKAIVFDIELSDGSGLNLLSDQTIDGLSDRCEQSPPKYICVSMHVDRRRILEALSRGASAYISKESDPEEVVAAIENVLAGRAYLCSLSTRVVVDWIQTTPNIIEKGFDPRYQRLSPKEKEVFRLLSRGYDTPQIAEILSASKKTISNYRSSILSSLDLRSVREVIVFAEENGIC